MFMGFCFLESLSLVDSDCGNKKGIRHLRTHSSKGHVGGAGIIGTCPQDSRSAMRSECAICMHVCVSVHVGEKEFRQC